MSTSEQDCKDRTHETHTCDLISRQAVKELAHNQVREKYCGAALKEHRDFYIKLADSIIDLLPSAQPEITHEQAVEYLQSTGWMQEHDRQMMLDGVHRLTAQPEIIRCKDCKHWDGVDTCDVIDAPVWDNDFCSMAERRSDEE